MSTKKRYCFLWQVRQSERHGAVWLANLCDSTTFWGSYRGDRSLVLFLPRLAVLVRIEADRPGALFPGLLGPYQAWFIGIQLSLDFERVKVP
jgi:hypothetical protein